MRTVILLIAYKRFDMLNKVIEALNKNKHYDLIVSFDYHDDIQNYNIFKEKVLNYFPNAIIKMRQFHFGLDLNVIFSLNEAFSLYNYDRVFYIEDDVYCDPTCLETLENLMNWTDKNLDNIGIVQSWNNILVNDFYLNLHGLQNLDCSKTFTYKENEIAYAGQNFWGALISKTCWNNVSPYIIKHYNSYINNNNVFDFRNFQDILCNLILSNVSDAVKYRLINRFHKFSWEAILELTMAATNMYKIALTNPRSKTMGENGSTSQSDMFISSNLDKIQTLNSPNVPNQFILNQPSKKLWLKE